MNDQDVQIILGTKVYMESLTGAGETVCDVSELINETFLVEARKKFREDNKAFYKRVLAAIVYTADKYHVCRVIDVDSVSLKLACGVL